MSRKEKKLKEALSDKSCVCRAHTFAAFIIIPMAMTTDQGPTLLNMCLMICLYYLTAIAWAAGEQLFYTIKRDVKRMLVDEIRHEGGFSR